MVKKLSVMLSMLALATLILSGCKKDKEDPTITVTTPAEHAEFNKSDVVHLEVTFADDRDLASFTMMVGDMDGEHIDNFHLDDSGDLTGSSYDYHKMITIPDSVLVSMFYLHFTVTDAEGKTASKKHMLHIM